MNSSIRAFRITIAAGVAALALVAFAAVGSAQAATVISGPIGLGTAGDYGVLAGSAITNTGLTVVTGDIGVSPQTSITGFTGAPDGTSSGAVNVANFASGQAKSDLTTAYNVAASLTPTSSGLADLSGMSLVPGVYSGGALSIANNGVLTLAGTSASSIWVFQASSSLTIGSATQIVITGGATACNVFWQVGSSASIGTSAQFKGTVMAAQSISATTGAAIQGRLLASTGAVTLQANPITAPSGCAPAGTPTTTGGPVITSSAPTSATAGTAYSFRASATGAPGPTFAVTGGTLPSGLQVDSTTGEIAGTPDTAGTSTFTITASNTAGSTSAAYTLVTMPAAAAEPELAATGANPTVPILYAGMFVLGGAALVAGLVARRGGARRHRAG